MARNDKPQIADASTTSEMTPGEEYKQPATLTLVSTVASTAWPSDANRIVSTIVSGMSLDPTGKARTMSSARTLLAFALMSAMLFPSGGAVAQNAPTIDQINDDIKRKEAELRQKQLELQLLQADIDLSKATRLSDVTEDTALAEAEKTLATAETNAKIAKQIGEVKNASYSGAVDLNDKTGTVEARLLATKAVASAATKIVAGLPERTTATVLVLPYRTFDSFSSYMTYQFRKEMVSNALKTVLPTPESRQGDEPTAPGIAVAGPAVVSAGLDAMGKLLSFFKTDYKFGGIDVTLDESVAISAVAGELNSTKTKHGIQIVRTPKTYMLDAQDKAMGEIVKELQDLVRLRSDATMAQRRLKAEIARLTQEAGKESDPGKKGALEKQAEERKEEVARIQAAIDIYDQFSASITAAPTEGQKMPLLNLVEEKAIWTMAKEPDTGILLIRLETTGGGYVIKKSMWTGLGSAPLYHMGGSAITYTFLNGTAGEVLAAGTVAVHGGFVKSSELGEVLSGESNGSGTKN